MESENGSARHSAARGGWESVFGQQCAPRSRLALVQLLIVQHQGPQCVTARSVAVSISYCVTGSRGLAADKRPAKSVEVADSPFAQLPLSRNETGCLLWYNGGQIGRSNEVALTL